MDSSIWSLSALRAAIRCCLATYSSSNSRKRATARSKLISNLDASSSGISKTTIFYISCLTFIFYCVLLAVSGVSTLPFFTFKFKFSSTDS